MSIYLNVGLHCGPDRGSNAADAVLQRILAVAEYCETRGHGCVFLFPRGREPVAAVTLSPSSTSRQVAMASDDLVKVASQDCVAIYNGRIGGFVGPVPPGAFDKALFILPDGVTAERYEQIRAERELPKMMIDVAVIPRRDYGFDRG